MDTKPIKALIKAAKRLSEVVLLPPVSTDDCSDRVLAQDVLNKMPAAEAALTELAKEDTLETAVRELNDSLHSSDYTEALRLADELTAWIVKPRGIWPLNKFREQAREYRAARGLG